MKDGNDALNEDSKVFAKQLEDAMDGVMIMTVSDPRFKKAQEELNKLYNMRIDHQTLCLRKREKGY